MAAPVPTGIRGPHSQHSGSCRHGQVWDSCAGFLIVFLDNKSNLYQSRVTGEWESNPDGLSRKSIQDTSAPRGGHCGTSEIPASVMLSASSTSFIIAYNRPGEHGESITMSKILHINSKKNALIQRKINSFLPDQDVSNIRFSKST
ncbi:hypothetical protein [Paenibacillus jiagnxiensis]|uniref:hypothetical protein n=1 Tax=Paenibacillus jiagnxiensis TaxID=3228926 RepID=UPI0038D457C6